MRMSESMMIKKCQANDPEGFRALMQAYGPLVYRTCFYKTTLTPSTLLKLQKHIPLNATRFMAKQAKQKSGRFLRQKGKALLAR